jgi:hypothetical protein
VGRFVSAENGEAVYALPNEMHRGYCEEVKREVAEALSAKFGTPVKLRLITDPEEEPGRHPVEGSPASGRKVENSEPDDETEEEPDLLDPEVFAAETEPAGQGLSPAERLKLTFPGAEEV